MKVLEVKNVSKIFPGVVALDSCDIAFNTGEIHCIMGENGAGKSTLIKCLTGFYKTDEGEILIHDQNVDKNKSLLNKIAYVPQEIDLFDYMTVAENLFIPFERSNIYGMVNQRKLEEKAKPLLNKFKINVSPGTLVKNISVSQQQLVQSIRAIANENYEILILDEPTTSLTFADTEILFDIIRELKNKNKVIIFVSHKLSEIFNIGDVITVFRNGVKISHAPVKNVDSSWITSSMSGRDINHEQLYYSNNTRDKVLLEVNHLTGDSFTDISFNLKEGEILGFAGLIGAGRSELMQGILGYLPVYSGTVRLEGKKYKLGDSHYAVKNGFIYLPEERKKQGILPWLSIRENISISVIDDLCDNIFISLKKEKTLSSKVISLYEVITPDDKKAIRFLSGGNQQKVIIGRSMICKPKILVFDEPTKGIDVGTKSAIYSLMQKIVEKEKIAIILVSSEMEEIIRCSNRVIAMYNGRISGKFYRDFSKNNILNAMIGLS